MGRHFRPLLPLLANPWLSEVSFSNSLLLPACCDSFTAFPALYLKLPRFPGQQELEQSSVEAVLPSLLLLPASTPNLTHPLCRALPENENTQLPPEEMMAIKKTFLSQLPPANPQLISHLWPAPEPAQPSCFPGKQQQLKARGRAGDS